MRGPAVTVLMALAVAPLAGCGPRLHGVTGVTVDDQHRPVLVVAPCGGSVGAVVLDVHDPREPWPADPARVAWDAPETLDDPFRFSPWGDHGGWELSTAPGEAGPAVPPPLGDSYSYSFHGMRSGFLEDSRTQVVHFRLSDLATLERGQVRYIGWDNTSGEPKVASEAAFLGAACAPPP